MSGIDAAGRWRRRMAMGLSVAPLDRIYFFLVNYWVTHGWAQVATDGHGALSVAPLEAVFAVRGG